MRFIDEYREIRPKHGSIYEDYVVVDGQSVLEYYLNNYLDDIDGGFKGPVDVETKELPIMAPALDLMFLDFKLPYDFYLSRGLKDIYPKDFGVAIKYVQDKKFMTDVFTENLKTLYPNVPENFERDVVPDVVERAKWVLFGTLIFKTSYKRVSYMEPFCRFLVYIDSNGKIIEFPSINKGKDGYNSFLIYSPAFSLDSMLKNFIKRDSKEEVDDWYIPQQNFSHICINASLLTITFMHCKNILKNETLPDKKEARRRERHHKIRWLSSIPSQFNLIESPLRTIHMVLMALETYLYISVEDILKTSGRRVFSGNIRDYIGGICM